MESSVGFICVEWAVPKSTGDGLVRYLIPLRSATKVADAAEVDHSLTHISSFLAMAAERAYVPKMGPALMTAQELLHTHLPHKSVECGSGVLVLPQHPR